MIPLVMHGGTIDFDIRYTSKTIAILTQFLLVMMWLMDQTNAHYN